MRAAVLPLTGAVAAALLGACTASHAAPPRPSSPTTTTRCVVTTARSGSTPPSLIHPAQPQPVPWITSFVGNRAIWVGLPADSTLHPDPGANSPIAVKFPWWRLKPGLLSITARRLDGPSGGFHGIAGGGYGDRGFNPSELDFPAAGCWKVTGTLVDGAVSVGALSVTLRVTSSH